MPESDRNPHAGRSLHRRRRHHRRGVGRPQRPRAALLDGAPHRRPVVDPQRPSAALVDPERLHGRHVRRRAGRGAAWALPAILEFRDGGCVLPPRALRRAHPRDDGVPRVPPLDHSVPRSCSSAARVEQRRQAREGPPRRSRERGHPDRPDGFTPVSAVVDGAGRPPRACTSAWRATRTRSSGRPARSSSPTSTRSRRTRRSIRTRCTRPRRPSCSSTRSGARTDLGRVSAQLFKTNVKDGILGSFTFDKNGDTSHRAITIYKIKGGAGPSIADHPEAQGLIQRAELGPGGDSGPRLFAAPAMESTVANDVDSHALVRIRQSWFARATPYIGLGLVLVVVAWLVVNLVKDWRPLRPAAPDRAHERGASTRLVALGYTLVYGILELINFAHGDVFMLGGMIAATFARQRLRPRGRRRARRRSCRRSSVALVVAMVGLRPAQRDDRARRLQAAAQRAAARAADHRDRRVVHPPERRPHLEGAAAGRRSPDIAPARRRLHDRTARRRRLHAGTS